MAKTLILLGCVLVAAGVLWHFAPWLFSWFGKLPGDVNIETERGRTFIPLTSMVIVSVLLSLIINIFRG
ncbi:hypothetical protein MPL1_08599 [Methylophaga lonarensis MPL]|uniref:DUF2905 domain-containing protein n=1 Tax=Methylophaga lonarensis MPL TaxID=1286106 RepID=M7P015_9GAMM|nr:DUF2905 domain-containing protein [Methylophaga lonarensis]EMR12791.1 hypothetical protein MPL1_08599 [Methylophaga lonarensis MPL]